MIVSGCYVHVDVFLDVFIYRSNALRCWLDGVLPMVLDREVGAQEKCLQVLENILLANITSIDK